MRDERFAVNGTAFWVGVACMAAAFAFWTYSFAAYDNDNLDLGGLMLIAYMLASLAALIIPFCFALLLPGKFVSRVAFALAALVTLAAALMGIWANVELLRSGSRVAEWRWLEWLMAGSTVLAVAATARALLRLLTSRPQERRT